MVWLYAIGWVLIGLFVFTIIFVIAWNLRNDRNKNSPIRIKMKGNSPDLFIEGGKVTREGTQDNWLLKGLFHEARTDSAGVDGGQDPLD